MDGFEVEAIKLLQTLDAGKDVSRWQCLKYAKELYRLTRTEKYKHLYHDIEIEIESARETL